MIFWKIVPCGLALIGAGTLAASVAAQAPSSAAGSGEAAGAALSRHLNTLAQNPSSLSALMGAGRASLDVGDPDAALTFFARAEEQAPRDGRIKMWMGSALVQLEQGDVALKFFTDAAGLGVAEAEFAGDRGLAHDMRGDQRSAQRDYALALRRGRDPEITRRLALSLAISGQREAALKLLEEQLLRGDRAASRTRALVLALTGDAAKANEAARASMPTSQAAAMAPFLARLPSLSPSERALAVHFGRFPGDRPVQTAQNRPAPAGSGARTASATLTAGRPDRTKPALGSRTTPPAAVTIRAPAPAKSPASGPPVRVAAAKPAATVVPKPAVPKPTVAATAAPISNRAAARPADTGPPSAPPTQQRPTERAALDATTAPRIVAASPEPAPPAQPTGGLADIAALVAALPANEAPARATPAAAQPKPPVKAAVAPVKTAAKPAATPVKVAAKPAAKPAAAPTPAVREPSRRWVQIAGGADKLALPREFNRLKAKAPAAFGTRTGWTTPLSATNRLLVGPFKTDAEAQTFVNELSKAEISAFSWTSPAGQAIEKLPAR